ncbi:MULTISPECIES: RNA-binding S4 domain-containing protein [unclassified Moraxella]|uniref:RNA-binding S4 domain-containing protein n=1 Tax=unclassified Moraxella TaxID=2685852 RepID=UPI003AF59012
MQKTTDTTSPSAQKVRLDKWLWAARFYKTRTIAKEAIEAGRVHHFGNRVKVSKEIMVGDELTIRQGSANLYTQKTVKVLALSQSRGNATIASTLYQETEESISQREFFHEQRQLANLARPDHRPNKKQRRQLANFLGHQPTGMNRDHGEY